MTDVGSNLLEHKRRVVFTNNVVKQGIGIGQQETVLLLIQLADFLIDIVEQADIVDVSQGQLARIDDAIVLAPEFFGR